jgi:hypothetical protein
VFPDTPILIEVPEAWDQVPAGELVHLRLLLRRPVDQEGSVTIPYVNHRDPAQVSLNTDLVQREITLDPGECYALTVGVLFHTPGPTSLSRFYVQVNPTEGESTLVNLPDKLVRVVPSLETQVQVRAERICAYEQGVKMELYVQHDGDTVWQDFEVAVGPSDRVQAGATCRRQATFSPGQQMTFEVVVAGEGLEVALVGQANGARVVARHRVIIPGTDTATHGRRPFTFLEPRALTTDRIVVHPVGGGKELSPERGTVPVSGGGERYSVKIYPSDQQAIDVVLVGVPARSRSSSATGMGTSGVSS